MKRFCMLALGVAVICGAARAQTFPFDEDFATYAPGSTGAPAWSALRSMQWTVEDGALKGPVLARFNLRPPRQFTAEITVSGVPTASWNAGFCFNGQDEKRLEVRDAAELLYSAGPGGATTRLGIYVDESRREEANVASVGEGPIRMRLVADSETERFAVYVGDEKVYSGVSEYPAGLLAVELSDNVALKRFSLRAPTADEKHALLATTLLNGPRDIVDGGNGQVLVLHRGSPAVLSLTPDGEVKRTFGRRIPGGLTDPVAMAVGKSGEVLILNRSPGEVIAYDQNGGIRRRFGKGKLARPADITVLPSGAIYVADADAHSVVVFRADGAYLGSQAFGEDRPSHVGADATGNLVVSFAQGDTVTLQPAADAAELRMIRRYPTEVTSILGLDGSTWAYNGMKVVSWPPSGADAPAFAGLTVGGLGSFGRLAKAGDTVYVLDRDHSRIVAVPPGLKESVPAVTFQNVAGTAALARWDSVKPELESRLKLLRGTTWLTLTEKSKSPTMRHQVAMNKLLPGTTYRYCVSPAVPTIPPSDWSPEFTFQTPGSEAKP